MNLVIHNEKFIVGSLSIHEGVLNDWLLEVIVIGLSSTLVVPSLMVKLVKHHEWPGFVFAFPGFESSREILFIEKLV